MSEDFFGDFLGAFNTNIKKDDHVIIIGKSKYKGLTGYVKRIYKSGEENIKMYTIELSINGENVEMDKNHIKLHYANKH